MVEDDKLAESTWLKMVDDSKLLDTWESEESMGQIEINSIERCCSKSPRRSTEQRVRSGQDHERVRRAGRDESDRRRRGTPTEQRVMVPPSPSK